MTIIEALNLILLVIAATAPATAHATPRATSLSGVASWYDYRPGHAAAGPALRRMLGRDWRGQTVRVCAGRCVEVVLSDWCQCFKGTRRERIIDLDDASFAALAPLSRGVLKVKVKP